MAAITSPGLGSGLDVNSIVSQLMAIESRPLVNLDVQEAEYQASISGIGALKSVLTGLQDAFSGLSDGSIFESLTANSSDSDILTVSADSTALPSSFDVTVNRLAQRHKLGSDEFAGTTTFGGAAGDELTLTVGSDSFTIDLSTASTLTEIRDAIMGASNVTGVTANVITGDAGNGSLVLTAQDSGFDNRVQLSYGGAIDALTFGFNTINTDSGGAPLGSDAELDASLIIDGVSLTRADNSISDAIEGVTLNLVAEGSADISVSRNDGGVITAVRGMVNAFNGVLTELTSQSENGGNTSLLRSVEAQLRDAFNDRVAGLGDFSSIAQLGISTTETGQLTLDSSAFSDAMDQDRDGIRQLFSDAGSGIAVRFDAIINGMTETNGVLDSLVDGLNSQISQLQVRRENLQFRLESTETRLRAQFTALDGLVAQLSTTSNFLTQQLTNLSSILTRNS